MSYQLEVLEILKDVKPILLSKYPIKKIAVFGSVSRKEDEENSDIDILVEFDHSVGMEFIHLCYELENLLKRKVDLVSRNGIKEKYFKEIESELIYV
ncbi:MAG: nucleotidyltransferase [Ignavibacteria bacterium RIFOXYB2_FULL_35_12]|nr:MAG: nucleotidyltransferase [Ignavibacteria bacterium GWA2_36_19]OGU55284.1 MAG: nucleotidyltransferase [Ignavibacteria bacterium GWC2_35_8]OGU57686.1 MAG: nucleotidyltransferase [Ignavibacteria bacterium GWF2_35_20]OGU80309.1 MAG: nucleotidyltransferase [Ignavibacteria bacterium RIFOXYA2_FULL_35_9]OGU89615.1 MAG: nucleotidyltransferase [Ignavibacteria bacterium RIFOXYA12_FULL_35_25]OGU94689.1 MAG: nucleotidyltransferase [Ignavibacteria bacterium RIFOXYB12_FULL_35_14]OGV01676.1 MAG: nucleo